MLSGHEERVLDLHHYLSKLNTQQFEMMIDAGFSRLDRWHDTDTTEGATAAFVVELKAEILNRLEAWNQEWGREAQGGPLGVARDVYLHWGAKHICILAKEVEAGSNGYVGLKALSDAGKLSWQCMNMSV